MQLDAVVTGKADHRRIIEAIAVEAEKLIGALRQHGRGAVNLAAAPAEPEPRKRRSRKAAAAKDETAVAKPSRRKAASAKSKRPQGQRCPGGKRSGNFRGRARRSDRPHGRLCVEACQDEETAATSRLRAGFPSLPPLPRPIRSTPTAGLRRRSKLMKRLGGRYARCGDGFETVCDARMIAARIVFLCWMLFAAHARIEQFTPRQNNLNFSTFHLSSTTKSCASKLNVTVPPFTIDTSGVERYRMGPGLVRSHTHRLGDSRN